MTDNSTVPDNIKDEVQMVIKIRLPRELRMRADLILLDPLRGKARYGAINQLVNRLLREWLETQIKENPNGV